jgi:phage/plasmid-associated DNA primase
MSKSSPSRKPKPVNHSLNGHEAESAVASALQYEPFGVPSDAEVFNDEYGEHDADNGRRLLDQHGDNLLYVEGRKFGWNWWNGSCWNIDRTKTVSKLMEGVIRTALTDLTQPYVPRHQLQGRSRWLTTSLDTSRIRGAVEAASRQVTVPHDLFDQQPWLIPCANGLTYDLSGDKPVLRESRREDYLSRCLPVEASEKPVKHPYWDSFMLLLMNNDAAMVRYLRQNIALLLTGDVSEKCFWFWVGNTDTGKTTLLTFLHAFLGAFAYKIPLRALLKRREEMTIRHDLADIQGSRLVYCEEFKLSMRW